MNNTDKKLLCKISLEITDRYARIENLFPDGNDEILRHLAASSTHMSLFIANLAEIFTGIKVGMPKDKINKFLECCGCDFNKAK